MPPREGIYGLLAEFNTPSELVHATEAGARGRLSPHGVLHALSGGRGRGGAALPQEPRAAGVPAGRPHGRDDGVPDGDVDQRVGVSAEHRGTSAVLVACVHHSGVRVDDSVRRASRRRSA